MSEWWDTETTALLQNVPPGKLACVFTWIGSMHIETICQGCARTLRVARSFAGRKARCPNCGAIYVVPEPGNIVHLPEQTGNRKHLGEQLPLSDGITLGPVMTIPSPPRTRRTMITLAIALVAALAIYATWTSIDKCRREAIQMSAIGHLGWMTLALENYEWDHGSLPPLYLRGDDGRPLRSWRTLLLPTLECEAQFEEIDLSQPWNSPSNRRAAEGFPEYCQDLYHQYAHQQTYGRTHLVALVGTGSIWDQETGIPRGQLKEHPNAVVLISLPHSDVAVWEPRDITENELLARVKDGQEVLFVTAGRSYGLVGFNNGRLTFEPSL